jgi:hypothetical protein
MSLIEQAPNPSLAPGSTIDHGTTQYSEIPCAPIDPGYGFTAATALGQVSGLHCSYNPSNHSIQIRWPDGVTNWTRETRQPSGRIRGIWAITFISPSGNRDKAGNTVLVEVGNTMFQLDNTPAELRRDQIGQIHMDIYHAETQHIHTSLTPVGDVTTIAEIAAAPSDDRFTMWEVAAGKSESPFIIKSLRTGSIQPGQNIVVPEGAVFKGLDKWHLRGVGRPL